MQKLIPFNLIVKECCQLNTGLQEPCAAIKTRRMMLPAIGVYAGLIVNYSLNIIYVHIWCRLGLPSTVLVFIIVLWPIPGVYIIYQSASVRL